MRVAHDGQVVKYENQNQNQQFSLYSRRFEKGLFTQKSSENTSRFWLLTSWPLGKGKKWKTTCGKYKKASFSENGKKMQIQNPRIVRVEWSVGASGPSVLGSPTNRSASRATQHIIYFWLKSPCKSHVLRFFLKIIFVLEKTLKIDDFGQFVSS